MVSKNQTSSPAIRAKARIINIQKSNPGAEFFLLLLQSTLQIMLEDERFILRAIEESQLAVDNGCMPFGAILVVDGKEVCKATNGSSNTGVRGGGSDVTRHAEMELIRKACALPDIQRDKATLYTSTEPCVMCSGAIYWAGIKRVVYGCSALSLEDISGPGGFDIPIRDLYSQRRPGSRAIDVSGPCMEEAALKVHRECGVWNKFKAKQTEVDEIALERSLMHSGIGDAAVDIDGNNSVPVIDMSLPEDQVAEEMWNAANDVGFFTVINHGIPQEAIDSIFGVSEAFFTGLSVEEKEEQSPFDRTLNSGYEYMTQVRPSTGTNDQKESLQMTARQGCMEGRWPSTPENFESASKEMIAFSHDLACRLVSLLERKIPHLEPGTLAKSHSLWNHDGQCTLRLLHYPPMDETSLKELTKPGNVHWRAGPHTDWDCVTLLFQRMGESGLECRSNPRAASTGEASWIPVPPTEGGIAVNIGDMLMRWSDGKLFSNLHRVRMPNDAEECRRSRYSVGFFLQADKSSLIESQNSETITAGDYILSRIKSNFSK